MTSLRKRNVTLVSVIAVSLGFLAIISNHIETGNTLCATVLSGYFGFATATSNPGEILPIVTGETVLLIVVLCWAAMLLLFKQDVAVFGLSVAITALGGYFGYSYQERVSLPPLPPKNNPRH